MAGRTTWATSSTTSASVPSSSCDRPPTCRRTSRPRVAGTSGPYGYPIMVVYSAGQNVQFRAAELYAANGIRLPFYLAPQQFEYDYQVIIPQRPLATNT